MAISDTTPGIDITNRGFGPDYELMPTDAEREKYRKQQFWSAEIFVEVSNAGAKHAPMNSLHEAYSVILEEVDELWDEVKKKREARDMANVQTELKQIAAMALRALVDLT